MILQYHSRDDSLEECQRTLVILVNAVTGQEVPKDARLYVSRRTELDWLTHHGYTRVTLDPYMEG